MRRYTLAEARFILSHVYCWHCVPCGGVDLAEGDGWIVKRWFHGIGLAECCRCPETDTRDLFICIAPVRLAAEWLEKENAAIDAFNAQAGPDEAA